MSGVTDESAAATDVDAVKLGHPGGKYHLSSLWESHSRAGKPTAAKKEATLEDSSTAPSGSVSSSPDAEPPAGRSLTPFGRTLRNLPLVSRQRNTVSSTVSSRGRGRATSPLKTAPGLKQSSHTTLTKDQDPRQTLYTVPATLPGNLEHPAAVEALTTSSDVESVTDHTSMVWSEIGAQELMRQRNMPSMTSMHSSSVRYAPPGSIVYRSRYPTVPGHQAGRDRSVSPLQKQRIHIRKAVKTIGQILSRLGGNNPNSRVHDLHQIHLQDSANGAANPGQLLSNFAHVYRDQTPLVIERPGKSSADHDSSHSSPLSRSHSSSCLDTLTSRTAVRLSDDWDSFFPCPSHVTLSTDRGSPIPPKHALQARPFPNNPTASTQSDSDRTSIEPMSSSERSHSHPPSQPDPQPQPDTPTGLPAASSNSATSNDLKTEDAPQVSAAGDPHSERAPAGVLRTEEATASKADGTAAVPDVPSGVRFAVSDKSPMAREGESARTAVAGKSPGKKGQQVATKGRKARNPKMARLSSLMVHYHAVPTTDPETSADTSSRQSITSPDSVTSSQTPPSLSSAAPRSLWGSSPMLWAAGVSSEAHPGPAPIVTRSVSPTSSLVGSPGMSHTYLESLLSDSEENIPSPLSTMSSDWPTDFMYHDSPSLLSPDNLLASLGPASLSLSEKSSPHIFTYSPRHLTPRMAARLLRSTHTTAGLTDLRNSLTTSRSSLNNISDTRSGSVHSPTQSQPPHSSASQTQSVTQPVSTSSGTADANVSSPSGTTAATSSRFNPRPVAEQPTSSSSSPDQQITSPGTSGARSDQQSSSSNTSSRTKPRRNSLTELLSRGFSSPRTRKAASASASDKQLSDSGGNADVSSSEASPGVSNRITEFVGSGGKGATSSRTSPRAESSRTVGGKHEAAGNVGAHRPMKLSPDSKTGKLEAMFDSSMDSKLDAQLDSNGRMRLSSNQTVMHVGLESSYLEYNPHIDCSPLGTAVARTPRGNLECQLPVDVPNKAGAGAQGSLTTPRDRVVLVSPRLEMKDAAGDLTSTETSQLIPACDSAPGLGLSQMGSTGSLDSVTQRSHPNSTSDLLGLASKSELNSNTSLNLRLTDISDERRLEAGQSGAANLVSLSQCAISTRGLDSTHSSSLLSPSSTARLASKPNALAHLHQTTHSDIKSTSSSAKACIHRIRGSQSSGLSIETMDSIQRQLAPVASLSARALGPRAPSSPSSSIDPVSATPRCHSRSGASNESSPASGGIKLARETQHQRQSSDITQSSSSIDPVSGMPHVRPAGSSCSDQSTKVADDGVQIRPKLSPMFNVMSALSHYRDGLKGPNSHRGSSVAGSLTTSSVPTISQRQAISLGSDLDIDPPVDEMIWTGSHSLNTTNTIIVNRKAAATSSPRGRFKNTTISTFQRSTGGSAHTRTTSHCSNATATRSDVGKAAQWHPAAHLSTGASDTDDDEAFGVPNVTCDSCVLYNTEQLQKQMRKGAGEKGINTLHATAESVETLDGKDNSNGTTLAGTDAVILISQVPSTISSSLSSADLAHAMRKSGQSERDLILHETASERSGRESGPSSNRGGSACNITSTVSAGTSGTGKTSHASLEEISEVSSFPSAQPVIGPAMYASPVKIKTRRTSGPAVSVTPSTAPASGMTYSGWGAADALWSDPSVAAALSWGSTVGWSAPNSAKGHPTEWPGHTPAAVQGLVMAALATATAMAGSPGSALTARTTPVAGPTPRGAASVPSLSRRAEMRNRRPMLPGGKASAALLGAPMDSALLESMGCPLEALSNSSEDAAPTSASAAPLTPASGAPLTPASAAPLTPASDAALTAASDAPLTPSSDASLTPTVSAQSPKPARSVSARAKSGSKGGRISRASRLSVAASFSSDIFLTGNDLMETLENMMASSAEDMDSESFDEMVTCLEERALMSDSLAAAGNSSPLEVEKMVVAGGVAMLLVNVLMIMLAVMVVARTYRAV